MDDYFRRDQEDGITAPDLTKDATFAEHIVRARGKRARYTSVSLDAASIRDFGPALYKLHRDSLATDSHEFVEHASLIGSLREAATLGERAERAERARAIQAIRYAMRRREGLVDWRFDLAGVERKDAISWAYRAIQKYFARQ